MTWNAAVTVVYCDSVTKSSTPTLRGREDIKMSQQFRLRLQLMNFCRRFSDQELHVNTPLFLFCFVFVLFFFFLLGSIWTPTRKWASSCIFSCNLQLTVTMKESCTLSDKFETICELLSRGVSFGPQLG